ncbi:MAG: nucleotidyltransferase domain-containing protein, partial [Nanoarchaeota archaeon]
LVSVVTEIVPSVREIRIFGSYNNGTWNPETSDVDIFVEINDNHYSAFNPEYDEQRVILREKIFKKINGLYKERFDISLLSTRDVKYSVGIFAAMKSGRLLYSNKPTIN